MSTKNKWMPCSQSAALKYSTAKNVSHIWIMVECSPTQAYIEHWVAFTLMIGITLVILDSSHSPTGNHTQACETKSVWSNQQSISKCDQAATTKSMKESSGDEVGKTTTTIMVKKLGNEGKADNWCWQEHKGLFSVNSAIPHPLLLHIYLETAYIFVSA